LKADINILPLKDDMTFSSRNCLRYWTSGESSEPKAAVAMTQRKGGRCHVELRVVEVLTVWVEGYVVDSVVDCHAVGPVIEIPVEVEETV